MLVVELLYGKFTEKYNVLISIRNLGDTPSIVGLGLAMGGSPVAVSSTVIGGGGSLIE
jgi:hypothetical protein